jgi:rubrerythrin
MDDKGIIKGIQTALRAERAARLFYLKAADKASNAQGKTLLLELADFEAHHEQKLMELAESLTAAKYIHYDGKELLYPKPEGGSSPQAEAHPQEMAEILGMAMDSEKKAQERYQRLAKATEDPLGKAMFERLAQEEAMHHRILSDEFYTLSNEGLWVWAE